MQIVKFVCFLWVTWGFVLHWACKLLMQTCNVLDKLCIFVNFGIMWILVNNWNYLIFMIKLEFWFPFTNSIGVLVSIGNKLIYFGLIFQIRANKLMNLGKKSWEEMRKIWEELRKIPHKEEVDPKVEVDGFGTPKTRSPTRVLLRPTATALRCGENYGLGLF